MPGKDPPGLDLASRPFPLLLPLMNYNLFSINFFNRRHALRAYYIFDIMKSIKLLNDHDVGGAAAKHLGRVHLLGTCRRHNESTGGSGSAHVLVLVYALEQHVRFKIHLQDVINANMRSIFNFSYLF